MNFDILISNPIVLKQSNGLYTIIVGNMVTGEVTKQENLTRRQLEENPMVSELTLALLK